jgi:putative transposase
VKKSKFTGEQLAFALKHAVVAHRLRRCLKTGISGATFHNLREKYGGLRPSEVQRLKQLEEENATSSRLGPISRPTRSTRL